jgi:hypothetical protein
MKRCDFPIRKTVTVSGIYSCTPTLNTLILIQELSHKKVNKVPDKYYR